MFMCFLPDIAVFFREEVTLRKDHIEVMEDAVIGLG